MRMNNLLTIAGLSVMSFSLSGQGLKFKLQLMPDSISWGVYVKPNSNFTPSSSTYTGSGQVTIVAPTGFTFTNLTSVSGTWVHDSRVNKPAEAPGYDYISFGFVNDFPKITYQANQEKLLFTIKKVGNCPASLALINNETDPFNNLPNSANSNPGNDLSVIDLGVSPIGIYYYDGNYDLSAWNCNSAPPPPDSTLTDMPGLKYQLKKMQDGSSYGVYVKPNNNVTPTPNTVAAEGMVSIVVPAGFEFSSISSFSGAWVVAAVVPSPVQAPGRNLIFLKLVADNPKINLFAGEETLLFTFKLNEDCPVKIGLAGNFATPVTLPGNPQVTLSGNKISVIDWGASPFLKYTYAGKYGANYLKCKGAPPVPVPQAGEESFLGGNPCAVKPCNDVEKSMLPGFGTKLTSSVSVFPNPAKEWLEVKTIGQDWDKVLTFQLLDPMGNLIMLKTIDLENSKRIDLSELAAGFYFISIRSANEVLFREKLIILK